jgi:hypothetical protein
MVQHVTHAKVAGTPALLPLHGFFTTWCRHTLAGPAPHGHVNDPKMESHDMKIEIEYCGQ